MEQIQKLVNKLFEETVYSEGTEKAKKEVTAVLFEEYEKLKKKHNEIVAMGYLMAQYGDLGKAASLAGYEKNDIASWKSGLVIEKSDFLCFFRKQRWISYTLAFLCTITADAILSIFVYGDVIHYAVAGIGSIFSVLVAVLFYKSIQKITFLKNAYQNDARKYMDGLFDRYTKRLLNSVHYLIACVFIEAYMFLTSILRLNMTASEAFLSLFSSSIPFNLLAYVLLKNIFCKISIDMQYHPKFIRNFRMYFAKSMVLSLVYWSFSISLVLLLRNVLKMPEVLIAFTLLVYVALVIYSNLSIRRKIVFTNIQMNLKRMMGIGLIVVSLVSYQVMKMNTFILQPYISMVQEIPREKDQISYNKKNGVYTITTDKDDFKVLQLTDIHLGGSAASVGKDYLALKTCKELIEKTMPDFVIVTGDLSFPLGVMSFSFNNTTPIIEFSNFMRNIGVPWAFCYGNHDTERVASGSVEEVKKTFQSLSFRSSNNLLYPYVQPDITGRNNQMIELRNENGSLRQAFFLLDSNDYLEGINDYDFIHDDQVAWYEEKVNELIEKEKKNIPSMLFFHMPLQEYREANELYENGSDKITYFFGENQEKIEGKVCCSKYPSKLFDTAKRLGSTKAMFCGHDHYNNLSVEYEGIRLTYGMSIDYLAMPGIDRDVAQRGGTLITIHEDSSFDIQQIPYKNK